MLNYQSFDNAVPFVIDLFNKGKRISPKPNTMLSVLTAHSLPLVEIASDKNQSTGDALHQAGIEIERFTTAVSTDVNTNHSLEMDAYIKDLSKLVLAHIDIAKNVVRPEVLDFAGKLVEYKDKNKVVEPSSKFNIVQLEIPELLEDESFLDVIAKHQGQSVLPPDVRYALQLKTKEELVPLLLTGNDRTDRLVLNWLANEPNDFIVNIWNNFFTVLIASNGQGAVSIEDLTRLNPYEKISAGLAIYLFAMKLQNNVEENSNMDLNSYKEAANQYMRFAGPLIAQGLKTITAYRKSQTLVVESNPRFYTVKVDALTYRNWLEEGGCPEVLLGMLTSGERVTLRALIDEKAQVFKDSYKTYVTFHNTHEANKAKDYYRGFILQTYYTALNEESDLLKDYISKHPDFFTVAKKCGEDYVQSLTAEQLEDIHEVSRKLVADCKFYFSSAGEILESMVEASKANPNIDVREAATYATMVYLSKHMASQIAVHG